jgi:hypothetical protein
MGVTDDSPLLDAPLQQLEGALIDEFLRTHGCDRSHLVTLSEVERITLLKEASVYASGRLSEVESRAHLVHDLHHHGGVAKHGAE